MKYDRPEYIDDLPEHLQKYFTEEMFKGTPYPPTLEHANEFLLRHVFNVNQKDIITMVKLDEAGENIVKAKDFTKDNFHDIFNFNNWKNLSNETKMVALYWFYEEICEELKIYPPKFNFTSPIPSHAVACYNPATHSIVFSLDVIDENDTNPESAYETLESIAHELKHAQFWTKHHKKLKANNNKVNYLEYPQSEDYNMLDDFDRFCYYYDQVLYYLQPTELDSHNYGLKKAKEIFDETNKTKDNKVKKNTSLLDLRHFREVRMGRNHNVKFFENVMGSYKEAQEQVEKNMVFKAFMDSIEEKASLIMSLDPEATNKDDKIFIKSKDPQVVNLLKEYNVDKQALYDISKEIDNDIKKLYKKYKELEANEKIVLYKN